MGLLSALENFGSNPVGSLAQGVVDIVDEFHTTPAESADAEVRVREVAIKEAVQADRPYAGQREINLIEAKHKSVFVAGWRPFIGWVGGVGVAWHYILADLVAWAAAYSGSEVVPPPLMGTSELIGLVMSLLGISGMRSWEKWKGVARSHLQHS